MKFRTILLVITILSVHGSSMQAQYPVFRGCPVTVDFSLTLRDWDGFGFNYVETAQTVDYNTDPKDYGGLSIMPQQARNEITDLIFGEEGFTVKNISLHNEGEDWERWPWDGKEGNIGKGHDYNMYWPPSQVTDFLGFMQPMPDKAGLTGVRVTNGEPTKGDLGKHL